VISQDRRGELERVLRPASGRGPWEYAVRMAIGHDIIVKPSPAAIAWPTLRTVGTPPIVDDDALCSFVHEVGHCEDPVADRPRLRGEIFAWAWAIRALGPKWNNAMTATLKDCLPTYHAHLVDPADRCAWAALNAFAVYRAGIAGLVFVNDRARVRNERAAVGRELDLLAHLIEDPR
jgi:hypothetical protein